MNKKIISLFCKDGGHQFCIGKDKGDSSDPVNFTCVCQCHIWMGGWQKEKTREEYTKGINSQEYKDWIRNANQTQNAQD